LREVPRPIEKSSATLFLPENPQIFVDLAPHSNLSDT
jgi:hypothetical protein